MSMVSPRCASHIAEHSMCQPGRPRPHGLLQPGRSGVDGFHSTKSPGFFLYGDTSTRAPASNSSDERPDKWPYLGYDEMSNSTWPSAAYALPCAISFSHIATISPM